MSSRTDVVVWALCAAGLVGLAATARWAFRSPELGTPTSVFNAPDPPGAAANPIARPELDVKAFGAALWFAPPRPTSASAPSPPARRVGPPPHRLLGIVIEASGTLAAVVFDPRSDDLVTVRLGDELAGFRVDEITPVSVLLTRSGTRHVLDIDQPALRVATDSGQAP